MNRRSDIGWFELIVGIILIIFGVVIMRQPVGVLTWIVILCGVLAILSGIGDIVLYVKMEQFTWFGPIVSLVTGILSVMAGFMLAAHPEAGNWALEMILPIWIIAHCISRLSHLQYMKMHYGMTYYTISLILNILGLLDNPTSGSYLFNGTEVANLRERDRTIFRKGNIGFVFQSFNLIDVLNVWENVELPLIYLKMKTGERKKKVEDALERMKITHRAKHFPQQLSGGQQQRVAIARAVVANPRLILADEPTGNLDSTNARELHQLFIDLRNQFRQTFLIVTHNEELARLSDRILHMKDGKII